MEQKDIEKNFMDRDKHNWDKKIVSDSTIFVVFLIFLVFFSRELNTHWVKMCLKKVWTTLIGYTILWYERSRRGEGSRFPRDNVLSPIHGTN